jgi:hypothetical protein
MSPRSSLAVRLSGAVALATLAFSADSARAAGRRPVLTLSGVDAKVVERAREGASRRLADGTCLKLLSDFKDGQGRPLTKGLEPWGVPASEYLRMLPFLRGDNMARCRSGEGVLLTTPGVPRVYVCSSFTRLQIQDPRLAEAMVIHEMLHTLGLGEDPPSSTEITARVLGRCGSVAPRVDRTTTAPGSGTR